MTPRKGGLTSVRQHDPGNAVDDVTLVVLEVLFLDNTGSAGQLFHQAGGKHGPFDVLKARNRSQNTRRSTRTKAPGHGPVGSGKAQGDSGLFGGHFKGLADHVERAAGMRALVTGQNRRGDAVQDVFLLGTRSFTKDPAGSKITRWLPLIITAECAPLPLRLLIMVKMVNVSGPGAR